MRQSSRYQGGMTLVEILVAVAVFGIVAALAYGTLNGVTDSSIIVSSKMQNLQDLQRTFRTLQSDFTQLNPRPVREELATGGSGALIADLRNEYLVELTRGGWSNPLVLPRPGLQRVAYYLRDDTLIRLHWPVLDRLLSTEPVEQVMLEGVTGILIRYMAANGEWTESWPDLRATGGGSPRALPRAVEIVIETDSYGEIRRLMEVGG